MVNLESKLSFLKISGEDLGVSLISQFIVLYCLHQSMLSKLIVSDHVFVR